MCETRLGITNDFYAYRKQIVERGLQELLPLFFAQKKRWFDWEREKVMFARIYSTQRCSHLDDQKATENNKSNAVTIVDKLCET